MWILDLFCGGGGASMGMHQALEEANIKHTIVGIDIRDMPDYPFEFVQADVFNMGYINFDAFDFFWASPRCQMFTSINNMNKKLNRGSDWINQIPETRSLLLQLNKPFVIENVPKAPLRADLMLCGTMFNLGVFRHRIFEIHDFVCYQPIHPKHNGFIGDGKYFQVVRGPMFMNKEFQKKHHDFEKWKEAMGIDWISVPTTKELPKGHPLAEAIPPAYSKYIMKEFLRKHLTLIDFIEQKVEVCE